MVGIGHDEYLLVYSKTTGGRRDANRVPEILFRHPYEPGNGDEGWMKPSTEQQVADAKQPGNTPEKQFTRKEIEKHDNDDSRWMGCGWKGNAFFPTLAD